MKGFFSMFGGGAKKSPRVLEAERSIDTSELKSLRAAFDSVAAKTEALQQLQAAKLLGLAEDHNNALAELLVTALSLEEPSKGLTFGDFVVAKVQSRGGDSSVQEYFFQLLAGNDGDGMPRARLVEALRGSLAFVMRGKGSISDALVEGLADGAAEGATHLHLKGWRSFCKQVPLVHNVLRCILGQGGQQEDLHPPVLDLNGQPEAFFDSPSCQMSRERAALLSCGMPPQQRGKWELLFHSDKNGKSFNTFMSHVAGKGSTIVLISDKAGNVFGGFASQPWAKAGTFTGDFGCFVFSLCPSVGIHRPCGVNENFQWCGQGFNALPNGFGFGGQTGYFSVYVDDTMDKGMTRAAATYNNPAFAKEQVFEVKAVECWLVEPSEEEEEQREKCGTAMDRFKETNKYLEIAGMNVNSSAAYRADRPPEEEDNTSKFR